MTKPFKQVAVDLCTLRGATRLRDFVGFRQHLKQLRVADSEASLVH